MRPAAGIWLIVGLALLIAPAISAEQDGSPQADLVESSILLDVEDLEAPVEPGGNAVQGTWSLLFETQSPAAGEVTIYLEAIDVPEGWSLAIEPTTVTIELLDVPDPGVRQAYEAHGTFSVQADADRPAFVGERATVFAWTDGNAAVDAAEASDPFFLWADWRPGFTADPLPIRESEQGSSVAAVKLENQANGPARFTLEQIDGPDGCEIFAPSSAIVLPRAQSGVHEIEVYCGGDAPPGPVSACIVQTYAPDMAQETRQRGVVWTVDTGLFGESATKPSGCAGEDAVADANATPLGGAVVAVAVLGAVALARVPSMRA